MLSAYGLTIKDIGYLYLIDAQLIFAVVVRQQTIKYIGVKESKK